MAVPFRLPVPGGPPLLIAGPCSAETEVQLLTTCTELAATGRVHLLRAGIWKPRTKPGGFEGVGVAGLPWLQRARELTGLPVTVEVATAAHVEAALAHDVDVLWVGARTTGNPFSVQELADALRGVDIPVLVKNPIHPEPELWVGAVERLTRANGPQLGLIHRGFSSYGNTDFRNAPMWHLPTEIRQRLPELPLLCDPSHICGRRDTLAGVAQRAADLAFDGLIIEAHHQPDHAWSDAQQQLTPADLATLLDGVLWQAAEPEDIAALDVLRTQINHLDDEILILLGRRMQVAQHIGAYKKQHQLSVVQPSRWQEILKKGIRQGTALGLTQDFLLQYFTAVHHESISRQQMVG